VGALMAIIGLIAGAILIRAGRIGAVDDETVAAPVV